MSKKTENLRLTTTKGVFKYPRLLEPNTEFDPLGVYSVQFITDENHEKTQALITKLNAIYDEFKKELTPKQQKLNPNLGYEAEINDDGEETGNIIFRFKSKANYVNEKGETKPLKAPDMFDSKGKPISINFWSGSEGIVNFTPIPYVAGNQVGISLRINAVQVLKVVAGGERTASDYGFTEEDGYSAEDEDTTQASQYATDEIDDDELAF